jgi:hypothetical protein
MAHLDFPPKFAIQIISICNPNYFQNTNNVNEFITRIQLHIHTIMEFALPFGNGMFI